MDAQLELKKAELARQILNMENEEVIEKLAASMKRLLKKQRQANRIPGFAYTSEERIAEIRQAEKELEDGVPGTPHEEFMAQLKDSVKSWK